MPDPTPSPHRRLLRRGPGGWRIGPVCIKCTAAAIVAVTAATFAVLTWDKLGVL